MTTFLVIFIVCALFFIVASLLGHHGDVDVHADAGGDASHDGGSEGPTIFSFRSLMLFGVGFGAAGAIARYLDAGMLTSSMWGSAAGLLSAVLGFLLYRFLWKQQSTTTTDTGSLVGKKARVTVAIQPGEPGEVVAQNEFGATIYLSAQGEDRGSSFPIGKEVTVQTVSGKFVSVT